MVISTRGVALGTLEPSRTGREAVREDVGVTWAEARDGASVRTSAQLMTLDRCEFAALAVLLCAHAKGYRAESLTPLLGDLARVFRPALTRAFRAAWAGAWAEADPEEGSPPQRQTCETFLSAPLRAAGHARP